MENDSGQVVIWELNGASVVGTAVPATRDRPGARSAPGILHRRRHVGHPVSECERRGLHLGAGWASLIGAGGLGDPSAGWRLQGEPGFRPASVQPPWEINRGTISCRTTMGGLVWVVDGGGDPRRRQPGRSRPEWHIRGGRQFDIDGECRYPVENDSGEAAVWKLNGGNLIEPQPRQPGAGLAHRPTSDFNRQPLGHPGAEHNGAAAVWELSGTNVIDAGIVGNPGQSWHAKAAGDFIAEGLSDIVAEDRGEVVFLALNRTGVIGAAGLGNPGPPGIQGGRRREQ